MTHVSFARAVAIAVTVSLYLGTGAFAGHDHSSHPIGQCHELKLTMTMSTTPVLATKQAVGAISAPIARGPLVRLTLHLTNHAMGDAHGVKIFLDNGMIYNNDMFYGDDTTVDLDLSQIADGDHYLVANVCDHNDHVGVATASFRTQSSTGLARTVQIKGKNERAACPASTAVVGTGNDFVGASPYLGCCGRWTDWANGACATGDVKVN